MEGVKIELTLFKMSAFDRFVVRTWHWIWNFAILLLSVLLLRIHVLVPVLWLVVVVLAHSVHTVVLSVVATVAILIATIIVHSSSSVALEVSTATSHAATPAHLTTVILVGSSHWSLLTSHVVVVAVVLLWALAWCLVAVLILNALLGKDKLLRGELITWLSKLLVTVSKVAFFLQEAIFVSFVMTASLSFVFLVQFLALLLGWRGEATVVHDHLIGHHLLLRELTLAIVLHHAHHCLWIVEHLLGHLSVLTLHLLHLHAHVWHLAWHTGHLIGLHLRICVHIEKIKSI